MVKGTSRHLKAVRYILLKRLQRYEVKIYLFGSMASGEVWRSSDIDVAILPNGDLPEGVLSGIREDLENSRVPYRVELIDLSKSSRNFVAHVQRRGILWND